MEEISSLGKENLSVKVVLVLLVIEAGAVKEGSRFLPSRRVFGFAFTVCAIKAWAIKAGVVEVGSKSCCQVGYRFLKQIKGGVSTSLWVFIVLWYWTCRYLGRDLAAVSSRVSSKLQGR